MTGSARRLGSRASVRRTSRLHAVLSARRVARRKPAGRPIGRILIVVVLVALLGVGTAGGLGVGLAASVIGSLAAGLPDPTNLDSLTFSQPTIVYDRTGTIELARFEREKRRVVAYPDIPQLILDTATTAEDRSFWSNDGYDPGAIVAAALQNASGDGGERGASTITQQLVRARLLPSELLTGGDKYMRKVLEVIQSGRVTAAFPGEPGKQKIITAYLNEIYYGHQAYGIAAAAQIYFGVTDLAKLTPAQAALLAGLPKAPSVYDPYRYAVKDANGRLVIPATAPPVVRRDYVLRNLGESRWTRLTPTQLTAALAEPVVLTPEQPVAMRAPHFAYAVRAQLEKLLGGPDGVETGGYRVITTLDMEAQRLAERYLYAGAIIPNLKSDLAQARLDQMKFSKADRAWIRALRGKDVHNGALVALDYRHGDVLAYVGSAGYYQADLASPKFAPQHDAAAAGRQPGSAFKAIVYATAFDQQVLTPGSLLLDISTDFGGGWAPHDADQAERGPVLVRQAVQLSLNLPAVRALERVGNQAVADTAERMGLTFMGGKVAFMQAGLAAAIGTVETRPVDLVAAFGSLGNGGVHVPTRMILSIAGPGGEDVYNAPDPSPTKAISRESAFLMTDILAGNTDPAQNRYWAATLGLTNGPGGKRRPAAAKTGTADNRRDFSTYGYLAPPEDPDAPAIAVGVWMGNSDHSAPKATVQATSLTAAGQVWHAFLREYTKGWPVAEFKAPKGVVQATTDRWSGGKPGPWTRATIKEWFIEGTEPGAKHAIDEAGLLYSRGCGTWLVDPVKAELGPDRWNADVEGWVRRARRGAGVKGDYGSRTAYWPGNSTWGGRLVGPCPAPKPTPTDNGNGNGNGNGPKPTNPGETPPPPPPP